MSTRKLRRKYRPSSSSNNISGKSRIVRRALTHRREIDHGKQWFCIRTNIGCACRAELGLRAAGFDVFRPIEDRWRVHKHRCSDVSLGWFGRYMFVGLGGNSGVSTISETEGVESLLGVAGTPLAVRPEVLQRIADEIAGFRKTEPSPFKRGQGVVIGIGGAFAGIPALIKALDEEVGKATVEVELFKRKHELELDFLELKAA